MQVGKWMDDGGLGKKGTVYDGIGDVDEDRGE